MNCKDKRQMKVLDFPFPSPLRWRGGGGVARGVESAAGPQRSCVESEGASRGSPLSLQLKGLAVIGTKAMSSGFFPLLSFLFFFFWHLLASNPPHPPTPPGRELQRASALASYLFGRVEIVFSSRRRSRGADTEKRGEKKKGPIEALRT